MSSSEKVMIGSFLKRIRRPIKLDKDIEYKLVTIKMHHKGITLRCLKKGSEIKSQMHTVRKGDFILSGIDARNGAFGIIPPELDGAIVTNDFWFFDIDEKVMGKNLFLELTQTTWFDEICRKGSGGITQRIRLQKDKFFNQQVQLPPKANQKKLLKKISRVKTDNQNLFAEITHQQTLLKKLRQSILQDAISGELTQQWRKEHPNVEPASELLKRIKEEKERLVKEKKIKNQKPLPPITDDEIPFELANGWVWCRGEIVADYIDPQPSHRTPPISSENVPYIAMKDISKKGMINFNRARMVSQKTLHEHQNRYKLKKGDFIFGKIGTIGNPVWLPSPFNYTLSANIILIQPFPNVIIPEYLFYYLSSPLAEKYLIDKRSTMSYPVFGMKKARNMIIPLPSLMEQESINNRINNSFAYIDHLESQITKSQQDSEMLMQAVLKEAFEG
jgi:type I restriction enzyme, S subunit